MKIAFDARQLNKKLEGIGVYLSHVVDYVLEKGHEVVLVSDQPKMFWKPARHRSRCRVVWRPRRRNLNVFLSSFIWQEVELPRLLNKIRPDVYHAPGNEGVPEGLKMPSVLTMHDLSALVIPDYYGHNSYYKHAAYGLSIHRADAIACISKYTQQELQRIFPDVNEKTFLNYNGIDPLDETGENPFAAKAPYIVYNGRFSIRKNIDVLVRAFAKIARMPQYDDLSLLLMGSRIKDFVRIKSLVRELGLSKRVEFTGYVPREVLGPIIRDATCSVYPSKYEGFGFPPLEAMSVGCPVIVSHNTALIETVGTAGIQVPTGEINPLVQAIIRLSQDPRLRKRMVERGYRNVRRFSWNRHGAKLVSKYQGLTKKPKK